MDYGVLPTGFIKMRLPEIRAAIITDLKQRLLAAGLPADIQTRPDSVLGLLIDTFAEREAALWFQHTATRRWLQQFAGSRLDVSRVSTHSHPKVAAKSITYIKYF